MTWRRNPRQNRRILRRRLRRRLLLDKEISCRATGTDDEDILRAIRIIYSNYGFHYFHQEIYHHDHFRAALLSGKYVSILAENAHGQILGHVALNEQDWFPGIPEVCNLVVAGFARGVKASKLLVDAALEASASKQFEGIYAFPVIEHPISQKLFNQHGFTPCGFYVDVAVCVTILNKNKRHLLYLPAECEGFVCDVFETEGAAYEVLPEGDSPRPETELSYSLDMVNKILEVRVDNVGKDFVGSLAAREVPKDIDTTDSVMVYLNMNDPGCPSAYRYYRERGCIFAGCLPASSAADYLLLLHVKGAPIELDKMVLEPNYREMMERLLEIAG